MTSALSIALSGLTVASQKANAAASNIANARTTGAREGTDGPEAYTPIDIVETSIGGETGLHGVRGDVVERDPATTPVYEPDAPYADEQGLIEAPNVDLTTEIIDLKQAALAYKANAAVARVASEIEKELFDRFDETI
jgi:flagellar basal-body rod protein FlgC